MISSALRREVEDRKGRFNTLLQNNGIDAAIIMARGNFHYLTGYDTTFWNNHSKPFILIFFSGARPSVHVLPAPGEEASIKSFSPDIEVFSYGEGTTRIGDFATLDFHVTAAKRAAQAIRDCGAAKIGLELSYSGSALLMSRAGHEALSRDLDGLAQIDIAPLLWQLRMRKSDYEIEAIRKAGEVQGRAFAMIAEKLQPGMSEREIARMVTAKAMEAGADRLSYFHVIADLSQRALGGPSDATWQRGALLGIDMCVNVEGYLADFCRTYCVGKPETRQADAFRRLADDLVRGREEARPGMTMKDLAGLMSNDFPLLYGRIGHGIGLEQPEPPSIHPAELIPFEPSFVLALEPNRFIDGVGFLTVEENVVMGERNCELLSPLHPREIIAI